MLKRFLFACLTLCFFIFIPSNVSADNKIIRQKTARNATITAGNRLTVFAKGKTLNTKIMNGGIEDVFAGAVSQNAKVFNGGRLWLAGGKSYGAVVHNGGLMEVREHDNKSSYSRDTKLLSGGRMNVFNHSLSEKITVGSNGFLRVYFPKAVISDVTILSGGLVHVWKHGTAQNVYVAPGGVLELREESPVLKGTIRVAGQLKASFDHNPDVSQAKIILDLTKRRVSDVYYIENLDFLKNANISVNISRNQKIGSYKIASGAVRWKGMLNITVDGHKVQSIRLWKPVKIAGKYYTLNRVNSKFIELTVSLDPHAADELVPELEISQKHKDIFKSYGIDIVAENYSVSDQGKKLTQKDLDADVEHILYQFQLMGRKYVEMSKCRKIIIRGSHPKVAFARGRELHFKYKTTGAIRHELFHSFDPFIFAYRFWESLNNENFYYVGGGRKGFFGDMTNREIVCCFKNLDEFANDFTWNYAQSNHREDIASIFNHTTDPKVAAKWHERSRQSPVFRKKFFTMIANCAEATGYEYWKNLYQFSDHELQEIKNCYIDVGKEKKLQILYTKNDFKRYGWQRRTTMALMALDSRMIRASGIKKIKFSSSQRFSPQLSKDTLTIFDEDVNGMIESIFCACYQRNPKLVKKYLWHKYSKTEWARLFWECTFDIRGSAFRSSDNIDLYNKIICLKNFTQNWLPEKFWKDILRLREEHIVDKNYQKRFEKYNIKLDVFLPDNVTGETCSKGEINNAKRIFIACSFLLNEKFMRGCGIKRVAFAKNMKYNDKKIIGGIYSNGVLCLDPTFVHLVRTVFYELFSSFDRSNQPDTTEWKFPGSAPQDYVSGLARHSLQKDRADTFALMLWNPYRIYLLADKSDILRKKINLLLKMQFLSPAGEQMLKRGNQTL